MIKKILEQGRNLSTRLIYANGKIKEIWMSMVNNKYTWTEDMINKLQSLKGKTKLQFHKNIGIYHDNMDIRIDEDPEAKKAQGISNFYHEVFFQRNFYRLSLRLRIWILNITICFKQ